MIFFDVTKTGAAGYRSGLTRVSVRLREELGASALPVSWPKWNGQANAEDWFLTTEVFSPDERAGFREWLEQRTCRCAAIFHDAIPLKFPQITWPQSVARHPSYMKMLARFDRVWAVSQASREELIDFWRWQGVERRPEVSVLPLGADFDRAPRVTAPRAREASVLCVGIVEPRKNQAFLLQVADQLWREDLRFKLHVVGRVNPHFGAATVAQMKRARTDGRDVFFHEAASDSELSRLFAEARIAAFPTIAEGCGLPLLEALWRGVPCVCSDLPALRENADGGGCVIAPVNDRAAWVEALRRLLTDGDRYAAAVRDAMARPLPTWRSAADELRADLARI